jgi:hypothetical protein
MAIRRTPARSPPGAWTRSGAPTRRGSTPRRMAGAGSSAPSVRPLREGRRPRPSDPVRLGPPVHRRCLDQRGEVVGDELEAELLLKRLQRRRGSESLHADYAATASDVALPSERGGLFDGDPRLHGWRQHAVTILLRLAVEDLPGRHRDYARADALGEQLSVGLHGQTELAARGDEDQLGISARRIGEHIGSARPPPRMRTRADPASATAGETVRGRPAGGVAASRTGTPPGPRWVARERREPFGQISGRHTRLSWNEYETHHAGGAPCGTSWTSVPFVRPAGGDTITRSPPRSPSTISTSVPLSRPGCTTTR